MSPDGQNATKTAWPIVQLGDVADLSLGKMLDAAKNKGEPHYYLRNPNVRWFGFDLSDLRQMPFEERELDRFALVPGDVVICEGGEAGRAAIWEGHVPNIKFQKAIHRVRTGPRLLNRFLVHRLKHDYDSGRLADYYTGATIKHLTGQDLSRYRFPLPPVEEQRRIAAILDKADVLRAKRREASAKLDQLLQSAFLDMFGDPVTNTMAWPTVRFGDVTESRLGKMLDKKTSQGAHMKPYLANLNVQWGRFELGTLRTMNFNPDDQQEFSLRRGDLLMCEGGEPGRCAIWKEQIPDCYYQKALHRVRVDPARCMPEYVQWLFWFLAQAGAFRGSVASATIAHLPGIKLKKLEIPLPPPDLQRRFADIVNVIEARAMEQSKSASSLDRAFAALQHQAFFGAI